MTQQRPAHRVETRGAALGSSGFFRSVGLIVKSRDQNGAMRSEGAMFSICVSFTRPPVRCLPHE
jgi:hypothetical protein